MDNYSEVSLPLKNKKRRKMRNGIKMIIIDYQMNKKETIGLEIHCQLSFDNCQFTRSPQAPGNL
jgi:hypothetical protein